MMHEKKKPTQTKKEKRKSIDIPLRVDTYDPRLVDPIALEFYQKERR